jgi:citrate lyase gamma subunit
MFMQMEDKISKSLASKVEKQFGRPERKEALLQILGTLFVEKYLPKATRNPQILVRHRL